MEDFLDKEDLSKIELEVYIDEIKPFHRFNGKRGNYLAIGCLFVPTNKKDKLTKKLMDLRCIANNSWSSCFHDCPNGHNCQEKYHVANSGELHFQELNRANFSKKTITTSWLEFLIQNNKGKADRLVYFNILYINLDKLDGSCFGDVDVATNIYARFLRTVFNYAFKVFYRKYKKIVIKTVYQDSGNGENHPFFCTRNLKVLGENNDKVEILNNEIEFLDSNPRVYSEQEDVYNCNLIQFMDIILGSLNQCLFYGSNHPLKNKIAMIVRNLAKKLIEKPYSLYQNISFYPNSDVKSKSLFSDDIFGARYTSSFYRPEELEMPPYNTDQRNLADFF